LLNDSVKGKKLTELSGKKEGRVSYDLVQEPSRKKEGKVIEHQPREKKKEERAFSFFGR